MFKKIIDDLKALFPRLNETIISKIKDYLEHDLSERELSVTELKKIDEKTVNELTSKDYKGKAFICLDNALDDTAKANLGLNVELKTI